MKKIILFSCLAFIISCNTANNNGKSENKETGANPILLNSHKIRVEIKDEDGEPVDSCHVWFSVTNYIDWQKMKIDSTGIKEFCENEINSKYHIVIFRDVPNAPCFHYTFSEDKLDSDKSFVLVQMKCR